MTDFTDQAEKDAFIRCINMRRERPQTNGDRIRQMSDEELAKFIQSHSKCPPKVLNCPYGPNCDLCWFNWLRMEANDG